MMIQTLSYFVDVMVITWLSSFSYAQYSLLATSFPGGVLRVAHDRFRDWRCDGRVHGGRRGHRPLTTGSRSRTPCVDVECARRTRPGAVLRARFNRLQRAEHGARR